MFMLAMPGSHPGISRLEKHPSLVHCSNCGAFTSTGEFETVDGPRRAVAVKEPRLSLREYCLGCALTLGYLVRAEG